MRKAGNLPLSCAAVTKSGNLKFLEISEPFWACNGTALPLPLLYVLSGPGWLSRYSDSLRAGRSGNRIPVGARFSAPVQTGTEVHPATYTMRTGSFAGVKRSGRCAEVKERIELYLYTPSGPSWAVLGWTLTLPLLYVLIY